MTDLYRVMRHFIIRRRDGIPAYHLASLTDDVDFGINCVVRGEDLLHSTAAQLYLADLTGGNAFSNTRFYHHPLVLDDYGRKRSKSAGSISLKHQRLVNETAEQIRALAYSWIASLPNIH